MMAKEGHAGHRQRLRERFLAGDAGTRSDEQLLELLLTFAVARKDVMPLARELVRVFGGLSQVLSAPVSELRKVNGIGESTLALLKAVDVIQSRVTARATTPAVPGGPVAGQPGLFDHPPAEPSPHSFSSAAAATPPGVLDEPAAPATQPTLEADASLADGATDAPPPRVRPSRPSTQELTARNSLQRKLQVSNEYLLEFDQLARILHFLLEHRNEKRIYRKSLQEDTGLAERQVESLVSMGAAMGLIVPGRQVLTPAGLLIAEHDIFIEKTGSLEWCHYMGAGSFRNLVWFEIFNRLLTQASPMTQEEWDERLRSDFAGQYSKRTIGEGIHAEVRFVIDAYTERNFSKLELLHRTSDGRLYRRRYTRFSPLVLSAMIYDFGAANGTGVFQIGHLAVAPGSPAVVFGLDADSLRAQVDTLHNRGWLRYETTHDLDQIRLKPGYSTLEFLSAHFEDREPRPAG